MFTHTTATLEGLTTIRAFKAQRQLIHEYDEHQNLNSAAWFLFVATSRNFYRRRYLLNGFELFLSFQQVALPFMLTSLHHFTSPRSFTVFL
jgi:hypothetical protein